MSDVLKQIYNACDPREPATKQFYLDCSEARGSSALMHEFRRRLELADDYLCFLFSGHIGCGKSSEMEELKRKLADPRPAPGHKRFFPVLLNVSDYLDDFDVAPIDILLAIVTALAAILRDELGIELKDNYFIKRLNEVKQFFLSDVEVTEAALTLGVANVAVQRLKKDRTSRERVRAALLPYMSTIQEEINTVFAEARLLIRKVKVKPGEEPYADLVILLDNLEKIQRVAGKEEGLESHRELFLERYTQLTGMQAHFIYTVPLRLVRSESGAQLEQRYGLLFVLPMVKVIERKRTPYPKGTNFLRELLEKRLEKPLNEVFAPEALNLLLTYSGGHVRNLMAFVQNACTYTDVLPIALPAAQRAIQQTVRTYSTSVPEGHWELLAKLDRSEDQQIPNGDKEYLTMLENLSILEYINGGDDNDPFASATPWYAVNPIVRELPKFKAAQAALEGADDE